MSKEPTPQENARPDQSEPDSASGDVAEARLSASAGADAARNGDAGAPDETRPRVAAASAAEIAAHAAHQAAASEREGAAPSSDGPESDGLESDGLESDGPADDGPADDEAAGATGRGAPQVNAPARPANPLFTPAGAAAAPVAHSAATMRAATLAPIAPGTTPPVATPPKATPPAEGTPNGAAHGTAGAADGAPQPPSDAATSGRGAEPRKRAPRFPPGAARPGVDKLPPAYGGPLSNAAAAGSSSRLDSAPYGAAADSVQPNAPVDTAPSADVGEPAGHRTPAAPTDADLAADSGSAGGPKTVAAPGAADTSADAPADLAEASAADVGADTAAGPAVAPADTRAGPAAGTRAGPAAGTRAGPAAGTAAAAVGNGDGRGGFWRRRPVVIAGTIVAGLLVLYGAAYAVAGSSLARNASVLGVDVGGMSPADAEATLAAELPALVDQPVDVLVGDGESDFTLIPSESGLTIDIAATVRSVPGGNANPVSLVRALFGGGDVTPVAAVDRSALTGAIEVIAEQIDVEPVNGSIGFDDGEVVTSEAELGSAMDVEATADTFEEVYFGVEGTAYTAPLDPVDATIKPVEPAVTDDDVAQMVADFAEPAMSGPVTVAAGDHELEVTPGMLSEALSLVTSDDGVLTPELDGDALAAAASDVLGEVGQPGRDATIEIQNGAPVIIPEESGVGVVPEDLAAAVLPALTESGADRSASVEFDEIQPEFTAADAEELGVKEVIGSWRTEFDPGQNAYRNTNIGNAASKINNTLLLPGDTFSLNGLVGERTAANGFAVGAIISGGQLIQDYGGGVSQVATTSYHAAFLAGLEDVEHRPHTIYYSHYPVGAEATVSWGNFDMAFKNDTPHGVLVETKFSPAIPGKGSLEVKLWSTEYFEVETSTSEKSNFTSPPPATYNSSSNCYPNTPSQGFSVTTYRKVWDPDGELIKDESYPWTYKPSPEVRCGEEPSNDD